jgi:8-oxo-dGTP pyrophosphatase MutT (NUDIX family)
MRQVAGCVVIKLEKNDSKILLVTEDNKEWGIPKGGIEPSEDPKDTAVRETFEETGIEVRTFGFLGAFGRLSAWWAFPIDPSIEPIVFDNEILSAKYFSINNLPTIDERQKSLVDVAVERLKEASKV